MDLNECRKEIDLLDKELVKLFCRRLELAKEAGAAKAARGLPVRDPSREEEKLESLYTGALFRDLPDHAGLGRGTACARREELAVCLMRGCRRHKPVLPI